MISKKHIYILGLVLCCFVINKINAQTQTISVDNTIGEVTYESKDHRSNVYEVVSDRKIIDNNQFQGIIIAATDYYPYGSEIGARSFSNDNYRYGFQGQEKDDEVKGTSNSYNTFFRLLDSRIARWTSVDPITHHQLSQYQSYDNNPIYWSDSRGSNTNTTTVDEKPENHPNVPQRYQSNTMESQNNRLEYVSETATVSSGIEGVELKMMTETVQNQAISYANMTPVINLEENVDLAWNSQEQVAYQILKNTYGQSDPSFSLSIGAGVLSTKMNTDGTASFSLGTGLLNAELDTEGNVTVDENIPIVDFYKSHSYKNQKIDYRKNQQIENTITYDEISTSSIGVSGKLILGGKIQSVEVTFKKATAGGLIETTTYEFMRGSIGIGVSVDDDIGAGIDYNMSWELKKVVSKVGGKVISTQ